MFSIERSWTFTGAVALGFADNEEFYSLLKKKKFKTTALQLKRIQNTSHASCPLPLFPQLEWQQDAMPLYKNKTTWS